MTTLLADTAADAVADAHARIPFTRLLAVEWGKATDTRAARWLMIGTAAVSVLIMIFPLMRTQIDQTFSTYLDFPTLVIATLLPVLSIMTLTTEWTQRTVLTTFTQEPRRVRVVGAKVAVSGLIALAAAAFGAAVWLAATGVALGVGRDLGHDVDTARIVGFVLFLALNIMVGVAFGALLHNTAAAIVLFFVVPTVFGIVGGSVGVVHRWLDPSAVFDHVLYAHWSGHVAQILTAFGLWIVVPLAAGVVRTVRREIA